MVGDLIIRSKGSWVSEGHTYCRVNCLSCVKVEGRTRHLDNLADSAGEGSMAMLCVNNTMMGKMRSGKQNLGRCVAC